MRDDWEGGTTKGKQPLNAKMKMVMSMVLGLFVLLVIALRTRGEPLSHPPVEYNGRVTEVINGEHLDHLLGDTPDEMRPPSVVVFYDSSDGGCMRRFRSLQLQHNAEEVLPAKERLFIGKYDIYLAPKRTWFKFTPERDLAKRFAVSTCPSVVFLPRSCGGLTEWCEFPNRTVGCSEFRESCPHFQTWRSGDWVSWVQQMIAKEPPQQISREIATFARLGAWLRGREDCTTTNYLRNMYLPPMIPNFTATGYKLIDIPDALYQPLLKHIHSVHKSVESWTASGTQNSFHVTKMFMYNVGLNPSLQELANTHLKPIMEEWAGLPGDLEFTSFYGVREYQPGHWLRGHIDRTDVLVISATLCIEKNSSSGVENIGDHWPLEVIDFEGRNVRQAHPPGKALLYESAKLIHGRPSKNQETHFGVFLHYKPHTRVNWGPISDKARSNLDAHRTRVTYRSTPSVEPAQYDYTEINYGEGARWDVN